MLICVCVSVVNIASSRNCRGLRDVNAKCLASFRETEKLSKNSYFGRLVDSTNVKRPSATGTIGLAKNKFNIERKHSISQPTRAN